MFVCKLLFDFAHEVLTVALDKYGVVDKSSFSSSAPFATKTDLL